jgi:Magnesium chelatase, subunit ChlI
MGRQTVPPGPPGAGKSRLARRRTTILPPMPLANAIDPAPIHPGADLRSDRTALVTTRSFLAPHHTLSDVGLSGGGHIPLPGEGSRAHHGVLGLDELSECRRQVWQVLRQPLEKSVIYIQFRGLLGSPFFRSLSRTCNSGERVRQAMVVSDCGNDGDHFAMKYLAGARRRQNRSYHERDCTGTMPTLHPLRHPIVQNRS